MAKIPIFKPNQDQNPLSDIINKFIVRQIYLEANQTIIINEMKFATDIAYEYMVIDTKGAYILHPYVFKSDSTTLEQNERVKNYLYLTFLAQSVENFETLLKKLTGFILEQTTLKRTNSKKETKLISNKTNNRDRIKYIKRQCMSVNKCFTEPHYKKMYDLFLMTENLRHVIVHSNQIIKNSRSSKININSSDFKQYFQAVKIDNEFHLTLSVGNSQQLCNNISNLGFMLFQSMSIDYNFPVVINP